MSLIKTLHLRTSLLLGSVLGLGFGCIIDLGPPPPPCDTGVHNQIDDGECICDPGYDWCDPNDATNLDCCSDGVGEDEIDGDGDGDPTTVGDGDGDPTTGDGDGDPTTGDGDPNFECQLDDWCDEPDLNACLCEGCNNNGFCSDNEDCICPDCENANACNGNNCIDTGNCFPYWESCNCSDCAGHPMCS